MSPLAYGVGSQSTQSFTTGTGLGPSVTVGVLSVGPVTLRCRFHRATSSYALTSGLRTAVVMHLDPLWELWMRLRLWPVPLRMSLHTKPPPAKARSVPAAGRLVVLSSVLQTLNLGSRW